MAIIEHAAYYDTPLMPVSHTHTSCELMYIVEGTLTLTAGKQIQRLSSNDCVLIKSCQHHEVRVTSKGNYRRFIAVINPWELKRQLVRPDLFSMLTDTSKSGVICLPEKLELYREFERMADIFLHGGNLYEELSAALSVISLLYEAVKPREEPGKKYSARNLSEKVREYMEQHYAENIRIGKIAEEHFVSVGYLTHIFKEEIGMSPREYLSYLRCTRACALMKYTSMKFCDIADVTGFCCANDMSRKIREYYGMTPTQIRHGERAVRKDMSPSHI